MNPLIFVVGSTGVGKSGWAVRFAKKNGGVILNCDSVQTYRGLDIGAAKPTVGDRCEVKHFLFDVVAPGEILTAGDYRRLALPVLESELPKHPVFAVGGSGFYIQALEKGMFEIEKVKPEVEAQLRKRFASTPLPQLYEELCEIDPETGEELNPHDSYRIQRALIIARGLGRKLSQLKRDFKPQNLPYPVVKIGFKLEREELRRQLYERTQRMLNSGWIEEVRQLIASGWENWPILQSVGYKQVLLHLQGQLPAEKLVDEIVLRTVQLSKRQMTWFQRDKDIRWFEHADPEADKWILSELHR